MIFEFPKKAYSRRHGPSGYKAYPSYKDWLRDEFTFRCIFCLIRERWYPNGHAAFSVEHLIPQSVAPEKILDYDNLLYACLSCNSVKQGLWPILDPCTDPYGLHLEVNDDGTVNALSVQGNILRDTFHLNESQRVEYRSRMLQLCRQLQGNPGHSRLVGLFIRNFGFPDNLPDLRKMRPPQNRRPDGVKSCYYVLRARGNLPDVY